MYALLMVTHTHGNSMKEKMKKNNVVIHVKNHVDVQRLKQPIFEKSFLIWME